MWGLQGAVQFNFTQDCVLAGGVFYLFTSDSMNGQHSQAGLFVLILELNTLNTSPSPSVSVHRCDPSGGVSTHLPAKAARGQTMT